MRNSFGYFGLVCCVMGSVVATTRAQLPTMRLQVVEVYDSVVGVCDDLSSCIVADQDCGDGSECRNAPKCITDCPTASLPEGIASEGDYIRLEVMLDGWDPDPDVGMCKNNNPSPTTCSFEDQDCPDMHCADTFSRCIPDILTCHTGIPCLPCTAPTSTPEAAQTMITAPSVTHTDALTSPTKSE